MSNYTQVNDYSAKDVLATGDPNKKILGSDIDDELAAISTAIATKADDSAVVHDTGTETVAGDKTLTGNNTHSGNNSFSGNNTHSGTETMVGKSIIEANASVAANATTSNIWSAGNYVTLTGGVVTFTDFADAPQAGAAVELYCNAAHVFTDNANLEIDGDANWTAEAGDRVLVRAKSTTVFTLHPIKKTGEAVVHIERGKIIASGTLSAVASVELTSIITSSYNFYEIELADVTISTNNNDLRLRVSTDTGSTWKQAATSYEYSVVNNNSQPVGAFGGSQGDTYIPLATGITNTAGHTGHILVSFNYPLVANYRLLRADNEYMGQTYFQNYVVKARFRNADAAAAYDAVQIYVSAGTFSGNYVVRGWN